MKDKPRSCTSAYFPLNYVSKVLLKGSCSFFLLIFIIIGRNSFSLGEIDSYEADKRKVPQFVERVEELLRYAFDFTLPVQVLNPPCS